MAKYTEVKGTTIRKLSTDPPAPLLGEIWFNSTSGAIKGYKDLPLAWATGGNLNSAHIQYGAAGSGTLTSGLIFGGYFMIETESYNGSSWTEVNDLNFPGRLAAASQGVQGVGTQTAALAISGYGGPFFGSSQLNTNENWNGTNWSEDSDLNSARYDGSAAGTQTSSIVFGGRNPGAVANTETFNGSNWTEVSDLNTARRLLGGAGANNTSALAISGENPGNPVYSLTESWNGSSWTEVNDLNTSRSRLGGNGTQTAALAFGGIIPPTYQALTEIWNGTSWTEVSDLNTARSLFDGIGTTTAAIAAGGGPPATTETEEFSGGLGAVEFDTG